jgi:hypothetical protein
MNIAELIDRKQEIRTLPAPPAYVRKRMAEAAQSLNRAGDAAAKVELLNEALAHYTGILYALDSDGIYANIDPLTGRLITAAPWGNKGWKHWGLRHWEAMILRRVLMARLDNPRHISLFDYNRELNSWHLAISSYPTLERAKAYLQHCAISLSEFRTASGKG